VDSRFCYEFRLFADFVAADVPRLHNWAIFFLLSGVSLLKILVNAVGVGKLSQVESSAMFFLQFSGTPL
jgi:hypothetical protein